MDDSIQHDEAGQRFHTTVDGQRCVLDYRLDGQRMTITHTGVPQVVGGRGIAAALTEAALRHARAAGWRVVPACSYAATYIRRHPQWADLVA